MQMAACKLTTAALLLLLLTHIPVSNTAPSLDNSGGRSSPYDLPFWNPALPWEQRLEDLVQRLTLDEVIVQLANGGIVPTPEIPRLGIGPYQWDTECLRGDGYSQGNATAFPQAIGLAAAFSTDLIYRVAEATSVEVRAKNNYFRRLNDYDIHTGISCFSPVINIARDPRWGRVQETYGEDPYLTGEYAASFVAGLQGNHPRYVRASAGCKHFAVYSGPENIPVLRFTFNAEVSERDLRMTYLPAFRRCVEAGPFSIGGSYNALNGVPSAANQKLLTEILYGEWGFKGYVFSDWGAIAWIKNGFNYTTTDLDTATVAINAGTTIELTSSERLYLTLGDAVKQNKVSEALLRERVKSTFYTRLRVGEFDPADLNPYRQLEMTEVESQAHRELAVEAAMKSYVLLKNDGLLPLKTNRFNNIGVVGPLANSAHDLLGDYTANPNRGYISTPLDGLRPLADDVKYASGCDYINCTTYDSAAVRTAVTGNDINFVVLGTGWNLEGEGHDRPNLELLGHQKQLLLDVINTAGKTPLVLFLIGGGPQNISFADADTRVSAILQCFFPAQGTGDAMRHVILNDVTGAVPAARLPYTWPMLESQIPPMINYSMEGRTYRYLDSPPLYPFGYGLSYTTFAYSDLEFQSAFIIGDQDLRGAVTVTNTGSVDADEVVQVYIDWSSLDVPFRTPRKQLAWFDRVFITAGQSRRVDFVLNSRSLVLWYDNGWDIDNKSFISLYVGVSNPDRTEKFRPTSWQASSVYLSSNEDETLQKGQSTVFHRPTAFPGYCKKEPMPLNTFKCVSKQRKYLNILYNKKSIDLCL